MSDNYQAVYDSVRSRIGNVDIGSAVESVIGRNTDISNFTLLLLRQHPREMTFDPHYCAA